MIDPEATRLGLSASGPPREYPVVEPGNDAIAEGTTSGAALLATVQPVDDTNSALVAEEVDHAAAAEQSLVAWDPDLRLADDAMAPGETNDSLPALVGELDDDPADHPCQSRFFADAEARRLSRIKR